MIYILDVFALGQKPEFVKSQLTFGKVWILDISVWVTLRLKSLNQPKTLGFPAKVLQKGVIKVLRPVWLSETKGWFWSTESSEPTPLTLELREVVDFMPKGGGLATQPQVPV